MARRLKTTWARIDDLLFCMEQDAVSTVEKTDELAAGLAKFHKDDDFRDIHNMGELTRHHLTTLVTKDE